MRSHAGFSLVELMVSIVVGLLLIGGLLQVYLSSRQTYQVQDQLARMQESGRFAIELIARDLRRAGFWGGNADLTTNAGNPGPAAPATTCGNDNTWGRMIGWRVSGINNGNAGYGCATDYLPNTDILTVRYAGPEVIDFASVPADGGLYLRSTMFLGWVMTGALKDDADNTPPTDVLTAPSHLQPVVRRLVSHGYYVGTSDRVCPGGAAIPSLYRIRLNPAAGTPTVEEIVTGVEQLQVQYLVGDEYVDADGVAAADWPNVAAARVWVLVRSECPENGLVNPTIYQIADRARRPPRTTFAANSSRPP